MCLDRVDAIYDYPFTQEQTGYKIFKLHRSYKPKRISVYFRYQDGNAVRVGRWLHDKSTEVLPAQLLNSCVKYNDDGSLELERVRVRYPSGFHLFESYEEALKYNGVPNGILRVKYKNVIAKGFQDGASCIIARSICIIKGQEGLK